MKLSNVKQLASIITCTWKRTSFSWLQSYYASARYATRLTDLTVVSNIQPQIYQVMLCWKYAKHPLELLTERESNWILLRGSFRVELAPFIIRDSQLPTTNIFRTLIRSSLHTFIVMIDANNLYGGIMEKFSFASQRLWIHRPKMGARNWAPTYPESAWHFRWKQRWVHSRSRLVLSRWASWSTLRFSPSANETKSWIMLARRLSRRTPMWYENERASLNQ